jgi:hypothetical protein
VPIYADEGEPTPEQVEAWARQRETWEALFWADLKRTTGRDRDEWLVWLDHVEGTARRDGMLALLQAEGFDFRGSSMLERTWVASRDPFEVPPASRIAWPPTPPSGDGLPGGVSAGATETPPGRMDSAPAHLAAGTRPREAKHTRSPREHAEALIAYVARHWPELPDPVFWERLRDDVYAAACREAGWPPRPWNPVAAELARLTGETDPIYLWVRGKRLQRLRHYSIALIVAASAPNMRLAA